MSGSESIQGSSVLHVLDPRIKLVSLMILAFSYSFVSTPLLLGVMGVATFLLWTASGLSASFILKKLKFPSLIIMALLLTLPFISGETILIDLGVISLKQEGLLSSIIIGTRFLCIITTALIILNSSHLLAYIKAMRAMGLPWIMADMALLVFRYLKVIKDDYTQMKTSMKLRGFDRHKLSFNNLRITAWLCGGLLVRGFERSDWIYRSMRLRGYGSQNSRDHDFRVKGSDGLAFGISIVIAAMLVFSELALRR